MKLKIVILIFMLMCVFLSAKSQCDYPDYGKTVFQGSSLYDYLSRGFRDERFRLDTMGVRGICWIKFKIDTNGSPVSILVSSGATSKIAAFLVDYIRKTARSWPVRKINGKPEESDYIVLPINYLFYALGSTNVKSFDFDAKSLQDFFYNFNNKAEKLVMLPCVRLHSGVE